MQQMFEQIEKSANDLIELAMAAPLEKKIKLAVETLKHYERMAKGLNAEGYWLAYSGGKDSDCILELAKMAGVDYRAVYNVTTIDPPELIRYMKREHPEVVFEHPEMHMMTRMIERGNGPPTRIIRWCCTEYKETGGAGWGKIIGVRAAESPRRKGLWKPFKKDRYSEGIYVCPIVYWTDKDVWDFHELRELSYCKLYDEGFKRLGCIGCPLQGPKGQARDFKRWPKYEALWKRGFKKMWDKWHDVPTRKGGKRWFTNFENWEKLWDWWISGKRKEPEAKCQGMSLFT